MDKLRRDLIKSGLLIPIAARTLTDSSIAKAAIQNKNPNYRRIATEEAFVTEELKRTWRNMLGSQPADERGFARLVGFWLQDRHPPNHPTSILQRKMTDIGAERIADMDKFGIDMMLLSLTGPGVQPLSDGALATSIAADSNDQLHDAVKKNPTRLAGLTAVAPQEPANAAKEIERGMKELGMKGVIINSHTKGEYLDDHKFWPILESAEGNDAAIYIHPRTPSPQMLQPDEAYGMETAMLGFAAETSVHALRIILSGAFDEFPKLKIVLGHLGEGLPFWLYRIDYMDNMLWKFDAGGRFKKLKRKPSEYFRENFWITSSGMCWEPAVMYTINLLGIDRVMYAADYPYQEVPLGMKEMDNLPISDADKKKFYETNAVDLFRL